MVARCLKYHDLGHVLINYCSNEECYVSCNATDKKLDYKRNKSAYHAGEGNLNASLNETITLPLKYPIKKCRKILIMATKGAVHYIRIT